MKNSNLYLHFLDRELRYSVNWPGNEKDLLAAILSGLCLSSGKLYCSYSHLWENYPLLNKSINLLSDLTSAGLINPSARHVTSDEFLASHTTLYSHDRKRYPMYFDSRLVRKLGKIQPVHIIQTGSTKTLIEGLQNWIVAPSNIKNASEGQTKRAVEEALKQREQEAVTGALFAPFTKNNFEIGFIRRKISLAYASHYMAECAADILTGIPSLGFYDSLALNFPFFDAGLFGTLLALSGVNLQTEAEYRQAINEVALKVNHPIHPRFLILWEQLIKEIIGENMIVPTTPSAKAQLQCDIVSGLRQKCASGKHQKNAVFSVEHITHYLESILLASSKFTQKSVAVSSEKVHSLSKIIFVVATDIESDAIVKCLKLKGIELLPQTLPRLSAWRGTTLNEFEIWMIRTEMAYTGKSGATLNTDDAICQLSPDYMIMPGIAFGLKPEKQKLGDILVAKSISDYETSKITEHSVIPRGEAPNASSELLSKARMAISSWTTSEVHVGEILSGPKLVNDSAFIDALKHRYPEAIGGEMEGCGFAAACERRKIPWLLVKGICDWGLNKTNGAQPLAATNAVSFCLRIVELLPKPIV